MYSSEASTIIASFTKGVITEGFVKSKAFSRPIRLDITTIIIVIAIASLIF